MSHSTLLICTSICHCSQSSTILHPVPYLSGKVWQRITELIKTRLHSTVETQNDLKAALSQVEGRLFDRQQSVKQREEDLKFLLTKSANALSNANEVVEVRILKFISKYLFSGSGPGGTDDL